VGLLAGFVLKSAQNMMDLAIDIMKTVAEAMISALNQPIRIPILSKFYKDLVGEELSIMDLCCLVAAIPSTVIFKAITNKAPFGSESDDQFTADLLKATNYSELTQCLGSGQPRGMLASTSLKDGGGLSRLDTLSVVLDISTAISAFALLVLNEFKRDMTPGTRPVPLRIATLGFNILYQANNITTYLGKRGTWYEKLNIAVTAFSVGKSFLDAYIDGEVWNSYISPTLDVWSGWASIVPPIMIMVDGAHKLSDVLSFVSNATGSGVSILSILASKEVSGPEVSVPTIAIIMTLMCIIGTVDGFTGLAIAGGG